MDLWRRLKQQYRCKLSLYYLGYNPDGTELSSKLSIYCNVLNELANNGWHRLEEGLQDVL